MIFFDGPDGYVIDQGGKELPVKCIELATGYLALVLRYARRWFLHHQAGAYGKFHLRWRLNLGIPSAGYDDEVVRKNHQRLARAAWWLSTQDLPVTLETSSEAVSRTGLGGDDFGLPADRMTVIPEVAAEVVGYAKSDLRSQDLHILVDIGASTLDICSFVLHESEGDDRYELLTGEVEKLGVLRLHLHRIDKVESCFRKWIRKELLPEDPVLPFLRVQEEYCPQPAELSQMDKTYLDSDFSDACLQTVMRTLMALKKHRYPGFHYGSEKVPVFLCGGGSKAGFYVDILHMANRRFQDAGLHGLHTLSLPLPKLANPDIDEAMFQFLGVAFGLSYPPYDIGTIRPPSDIASICPPPLTDWRQYYVSKDQV